MTTAPPSPISSPETPEGAGAAPGETGAPSPSAAPSLPPSPRPKAAPVRTSHRVRYTVVGLVLVGALGFLVAKGLGTALNFYLPANQAVAQRATLGTKTFNLEGLVAPGSIRHTASGVDFALTSGSARVEVVNTGTPPDLFQPDIPVIAVGHFSGPAFVSDQILVKHSSTYIAAHPNRVTAPNGTKR